MIPECWALIATYSDEETALLLSQRCGTIQIKHTYKDGEDTITTTNGVRSYEITSYGDQYWYKNGQFHREDGPVIIFSNGIQVWHKNDKCHREDGPALICANGHKAWFNNGYFISDNRRD